MNQLHLLSAATLLSFAFTACTKDQDSNNSPAPTVLKEWNMAVNAKNEVPGVANRSETGTVNLQLLSDNSIKYTISVTGLAGSDMLHDAHLHAGNAVTNGPVLINLNTSFSGGNATGTVKGLRTTLVDSLKNDANEIYFNAHSMQVASGLLRGQLNTKVEFSADVALNGASEVPAVTTTATGVALIRMTADKKLHTRITVNNLEAGDALTSAHIHKGAAGVNGAVMLGVHTSGAEFGTVKTLTLDDTQFNSMKNEALYVNVHSTKAPGGVIRGQIR